jgi:pteridine reductase
MNTSGLQDHVVFITGAAKRVGAALARGFHAEGCRVVVHSHRSRAEAEALCADLNARRPDSAFACFANLLDVSTFPMLISQAVERFGRLDVLINNASTFYPTAVGTIDTSAWDDLIGTNLKAPLFLSQAAAPALQASRGLIINLIDIHSMRPLPNYPVYSTAKAGLAMLTRSLARELSPDVRVNGISPGPILWPEGGIDSTLQNEIISKTLLKRIGSPEDIVRTAIFFARDATYVTGQILAVDGGRSVGW